MLFELIIIALISGIFLVSRKWSKKEVLNKSTIELNINDSDAYYAKYATKMLVEFLRNRKDSWYLNVPVDTFEESIETYLNRRHCTEINCEVDTGDILIFTEYLQKIIAQLCEDDAREFKAQLLRDLLEFQYCTDLDNILYVLYGYVR